MRQPLIGGAYTARTLGVAAQRCVNLYQEPLPQAEGEPAQLAHFPTPGLRLVGTVGSGPIRALRQATTGGIYAVSGSTVYSVNADFTSTSLGSITAGVSTPVSMQDNTLDLVIVDGTSSGWSVHLADNAFAAIDDPSGMFAGADAVAYLDTFLVFNKPRTPQFYISGSLALTFDSLDFANKSSYSDLLATLAVAKREVWLLGEKTTEIWYDAGATDIGQGSFQFAEVQSVFIDHGCVAKYSAATYDNSVFWLGQDRAGKGIILKGAGYKVDRISTYAMETAFVDYARIDDAIGFCYQLGGHAFYVLTFPTADKTWCYDITTGFWHEWVWLDTNGDEHRTRANCCAVINGEVIVGDRQNGKLYALDFDTYEDDGKPIKRLRTYPHILADGKRVFYRQFLANFESGEAPSITEPTPQPYKAWLRVNAGSWLPSGDPAAGTGGIDLSVLDGQVLYPILQGTGGGAQTANFGASSFAHSAPSGFTAGWPKVTGGGFTTLDPTKLYQAGTGSAVLSNGNKTLSFPGFAGGACQAIDGWSEGKYYFEVHYDSQGALSDYFGAGLARAYPGLSYPSFIQHAAYSGLDNDGGFNLQSFHPLSPDHVGHLWVNGEEIDPSLTTYSPGDTLGIAVQLAAVPTPQPDNLITLEWSDDRGHTYGQPVLQSIGDRGEYLTWCQWQRLGYGRDRVFRISWSVAMKCSLMGAFVDATPAGS